jgi:hypothetical protein
MMRRGRNGWLGVVAGVSLGMSASGQTVDVPDGQKAVLTVDGKGVQIYKCAKTGDAIAWVFVAPEAKLYLRESEVGTHGAGPVWSYGGGTVRGTLLKSLASPEAGSVPWLLLRAADSSGKGVMTTVTYIRRSETHGGGAPEDGCDADHLGEVSRVSYTAVYTFYAPGPATDAAGNPR